MEEWRPVPGYEEYQVSDHGRIRGRRGDIMSFGNDGNGYKQVYLRKDGSGKSMRVARLVALAFIPNPDGKSEIDHIDRCRTNNHISNLRWATRKEQIRNRVVPIGVSGERSIYKHPSGWRVIMCRDYIRHSRLFPTLEEAIAARDSFLISEQEA